MYKVGDKLICKKRIINFKIGKECTITKIAHDNMIKTIYYRIACDISGINDKYGSHYGYFEYDEISMYFHTGKEIRMQKLERLSNV